MGGLEPAEFLHGPSGDPERFLSAVSSFRILRDVFLNLRVNACHSNAPNPQTIMPSPTGPANRERGARWALHRHRHRQPLPHRLVRRLRDQEAARDHDWLWLRHQRQPSTLISNPNTVKAVISAI